MRVVPVCVFLSNAAIFSVDVEFGTGFPGEFPGKGDGVALGMKDARRSIGAFLANAPASTVVGHDMLPAFLCAWVSSRHMVPAHLYYTLGWPVGMVHQEPLWSCRCLCS